MKGLPNVHEVEAMDLPYAHIPKDIFKPKAKQEEDTSVLSQLESAVQAKGRGKKSKADRDFEQLRKATLLRLNQNLLGTFSIPIEDLQMPAPELASRDLEMRHVHNLAEAMEIAGPSYPGKPAVVCAFGVICYKSAPFV
jgi:hypothetical protein